MPFVFVVGLVHHQNSYFNTHVLHPIGGKVERGPTRFLPFLFIVSEEVRDTEGEDMNTLGPGCVGVVRD